MISVSVLSKRAYTVEATKDKNNLIDIKQDNSVIHKIQGDIDADRNKIIQESGAVTADRQKLKEAEKISDKTTAEQIKQDIEKRESTIKDLKKDIINKKEQKDDIVYGKRQKIPRRNREK